MTTHAETYALVFRLLADRLPTLSSEELTFRITLAATGVAGMIAGTFDGSAIASHTFRRDENILHRSVSFIVAALSSPPTPPPSG